jgi:hypothetical protein
MRFAEARRKIQEKLATGEIQKKNKLSTGELTLEQVSRFLDFATPSTFQNTETHNDDSSIQLYIFKPLVDGTRWYIKAYYIDPDIWFISVHK